MEKRRKNRIILSHRYSDTRFRRKKTGSSHSLRSWYPVHQWALPQHPEKIWNHPKYEQCRWSMPWQCPLWKHVGASKDRIIVWSIRQRKPDCIRTEVSNLEILYQLLEQSEDLHHQWWSSSHDQATEILWFSAYSSIVHDVLEKNVSTNLDNITYCSQRSCTSIILLMTSLLQTVKSNVNLFFQKKWMLISHGQNRSTHR